jgi:hypothetical protein
MFTRTHKILIAIVATLAVGVAALGIGIGLRSSGQPQAGAQRTVTTVPASTTSWTPAPTSDTVPEPPAAPDAPAIEPGDAPVAPENPTPAAPSDNGAPNISIKPLPDNTLNVNATPPDTTGPTIVITSLQCTPLAVTLVFTATDPADVASVQAQFASTNQIGDPNPTKSLNVTAAGPNTYTASWLAGKWQSNGLTISAKDGLGNNNFLVKFNVCGG